MYVDIDEEVKIFYCFYGKDEAPTKILCIMGWCASHKGWQNWIEFVEENPTEFQICAFDNRGCGFSSAPVEKYTMDMLARDAIKVADHIHWDKFHVMGASMGGMIGLRLATIIPERIQTLTLMSTRAAGGWHLPKLRTLWILIKMQYYTELEHQVYYSLQMLYPEDYLNQVRDSNGNNLETNRQYLFKRLMERRKNVPPITKAGMQGQLAAVNSHHITDEELLKLKNAGFKILLMSGDNDGMISHTNSLAMKDQLGAELVLFKGVGHGILEQCDTEIRAKMRDFYTDYNSAAPN